MRLKKYTQKVGTRIFECSAVLLSFLILSSTPAMAGWETSFSDEFNGTSLDRTKWKTMDYWKNQSLGGNNEQQCYLPDMFTVANGILRIRTERRSQSCYGSNGRVLPYASGEITTAGCNPWETGSHCTGLRKYNQLYGYFEIRARLPAGRGFWPAFWLIPGNGEWPPEIDIMENLGHEPNRVYMSYHYNNSSGVQQSTGSNYVGPNFSTSYNTFGVDWQPGLLIYYINGVERHRISGPHVAAQPMYILANLAVGGYWPGNPDSSTVFPNSYDIDYIRAYRRVSNGLPDQYPPGVGGSAPTNPTPTPTPNPGTTSPVASSLVSNPSFESNLTGWTTYGTAARISSGQRSGAGALRISASGGGAEQSVFSRLTAGTSYRLTGYGRVGATNENAAIGVKIFNSAGAVLLERSSAVRSTSYTQYTVDFTMPSGASRAVVYAWKGGGSSSYADFDDYQLNLAGSAPAPAPAPVVNIVSNPGFEANLTGWGTYGTSARITSGQRSGAGGLRISASGGGAESSVFSSLRAGTRYRLTAYGRLGASNENAAIGIKIYSTSGAVLLERSSAIRTTSYAQYTVDFTMPSGASRAVVFAWKGGGSSSYADFDDYQLTQAP